MQNKLVHSRLSQKQGQIKFDWKQKSQLLFLLFSISISYFIYTIPIFLYSITGSNQEMTNNVKEESKNKCKKQLMLIKQQSKKNDRVLTEPSFEHSFQAKLSENGFRSRNSNYLRPINSKENRTKIFDNFLKLSQFQRRVSRLSQMKQPLKAILSSRQKNKISEQAQHKLRISRNNKNSMILPQSGVEKMMLDFQRQMKRIKKSQITKCQQKNQKKKKLQTYCMSINHENNASHQFIKYADGLYVLCDPQGSNGKQVSHFVLNRLFDKCYEKKRNGELNAILLFQIFITLQKELEISTIDTAFSGCSCLLLVYLEKQLIVANLGDCRAVMIKDWSLEILSKDHLPSDLGERQRIERNGGVVRQTQISKGKYAGPLKIWAPGKNSWGPGIQLTRCFGHKSGRRYGLISEPQIKSYQLVMEQHLVIIGSKSIFSQPKNEEIVGITKKEGVENREKICQNLIQRSHKNNEGGFENFSVVLIFN